MQKLLSKLINLNIIIDLVDDKLNVQSPKGIMTDALLDEIKIHKNELIELIFLNKTKKKFYYRIPKISEQESYALSSSQRRLWLLSQFEGGNIAYNMSSIFEINGSLSIPSLEKAFLSLIERHESLRTLFVEENGDIRQKVLDFNITKFNLDYEDVSTEEFSQELINAVIEREVKYIFDLSSSSLLRAKVIRKSLNKYVFICVMHHIVSDGWSVDIMKNELFALYDAYSTESQLVLPELKLQYKDYAAWQQDQLKSDAIKEHEIYWMNQFNGNLPVLDLPTYQTRPAIKTYAGSSLDKVYEESIAKPFSDFCQSQGSTLFMGLLAAVKVLLYRYTDQNDIIIGSPIAGREDVDLQNQIGFYVNTLALRTQFDGLDSFEKLLENIKEVTLSAFEHQMYPFDELVDHLSLKRDMSRNPLFDVMVTFQNTDNLKVNLEQSGDITIKEYETQQNAISKFDIEFIFEETSQGIKLMLVYNTALYTEEFAENIINHLEVLLQSIISEPKLAICSLKFLSDKELNQLLVEFNDTQADYPKDKTILDLFADQVYKTPEKIALSDSRKTFSYSELDKTSSQIALYLIDAFGEQDRSPIAVLLDRSADMLALLLGILKCGRSYIPLDPNFPKERLNYIVGSSGTKVLISEKDYKVQNGDGAIILSLEHILEKIKGLKGDLETRVLPEATAYIIYTSGSTGNPKGVEIGHRSLLNFLTSMQKQPGISASDILFSVTTYSFDISILEFFAPLICGAAVYIANHNVLSEANLLIENINEVQPTIMQATPSFYQMLFDSNWLGSKGLKILCGGDSLHEALAGKLIPHCGEVWNMYGPTETTIWSSIKKLQTPKDASIIGKPISNTSLFVLDMFLQPKPIGTIGEIYIGGDGLAIGYYRNEMLSKERFIQNPFESGGLLYRTGDVGKWNSQGEIEFLGRNDSQIKIRGYRVELEDIENGLLKISSLDSVTAAVKSDSKGDKILVAYLVSREKVNVSHIRSELRHFLPHYMIPAHFIQLDSMPLTPNGKIDRQSLPSPKGIAPISEAGYAPPGNEIEKTLVKIWQEVLGIKNVGIKDNFFELGGHSLFVGKILGKIRSFYEVDISYKEFYVYPNIFSISNIINDQKEKENEFLEVLCDDILIYLDEINENEVFNFLSFLKFKNVNIYCFENKLIVRRDINLIDDNLKGFLDTNKNQIFRYLKSIGNSSRYDFKTKCSYLQNEVYKFLIANGSNSNINFGLITNEIINLDKLEIALNDVIEKHTILKTQFLVENNYLYQSFSNDKKNISINYREFDQFCEADEFCKNELLKKIDLFGKDFLLSAWAVKFNKTSYILFFIVNHIIFDGASINIFLKDLFNFYYFDKSTTVKMQFHEYTAAMQFYEKTSKYVVDKNYWEKTFNEEYNFSAFISREEIKGKVPFDYTNTMVFKVKSLKDQSEKIKAFCKNNNFTLNNFFLTIYYLVIKELSLDRDVLIDCTVSNRESGEICNEIGLFTNSLFLRLNIDTDNYLEIINEVQIKLVECLSHSDYHSNKIFNELGLNKYGHEILRKFKYNYIDSEDLNSFEGKLNFEIYSVDQNFGCYYILLQPIKTANNLQFNFIFNKTYFSNNQISSIAEVFDSIMGKILN
ncbi:non-ribosomal peptide synthetase [Flavobacterium sp. LHD-85]|uniref:non-ribosomal peptide synthetase n=1 Tax=Flavobacterium sp. LHD-85 TaxID=3071410 RepID=UPI0027E178DB|nr:non-ribosomal peptide synthetase [Flavobacterium sp. LHD-85]MDQ6531233.1 amino acid adenylation domain-containing protein [Flavobacterium sp. LHD-85]